MDAAVSPLLSLADQLDHRALPLTMGSVVSRRPGLGAPEVRCEHPERKSGRTGRGVADGYYTELEKGRKRYL